VGGLVINYILVYHYRMANTHNQSSNPIDLDIDISEIDNSTPTKVDNSDINSDIDSEIDDEMTTEGWTESNPEDSDVHVVVEVDNDGKVIITSYTISVNKD
jgi:hypothetical protein